VNFDPTFRVSFEQAGCMRFCEKIQGYNVQVTKEFSLNFNGVQSRIVDFTFQVSEETVVVATEIPMLNPQLRRWMKIKCSQEKGTKKSERYKLNLKRLNMS
jgi:hypothetical protein